MSEIDTAPEDWSAKATSTIVGYVDTIRGATTGKALVASRIAVYGVAAALVGMMMAILLLIVMIRFLVVVTGYWDVVGEGGVWLAYWILGVIFLAAGALIWRMRGN